MSSRAHVVADTAFAIAAVRADEARLPEDERLFVDPYAAAFAAIGADAAESTQRFLALPNFREAVRLRTRYLDDCVRDALAAGLRQVVLLGAGFDARALRMSNAGTATWFEIDTTHQLARKRQALGFELPAHVRHVAFDFDDTRDFDAELEGALERAGFVAGQGAMFVWEGVIGYIDDAAIDQSLRFMARVGGPASRVALTFADEAFLGLEPMAARTKRCGFSAFESASSEQLWRLHLKGEPHPSAFVSKVGLATV